MNGASTAVWPGQPFPLGASWDGEGVNFALFSEHAEKVELCLFDARGRRETARLPMRWQTDQVWHCYLPEARPGQLYGYRVYGPYAPEQGHRFNPNKLLLDPYARDIAGSVRWNDALFGYTIGHKAADLRPDPRNSAHGVPKSRVIDTTFTWGDDRPLRTPWHDTVIYELHVKGFTIQHPEVPPPYRGTYAGLATEPVIEHFKRLGVTAVELMPVHTFISDRHLVSNGLSNYWGYNSIGYFAPHAAYSAAGDVSEFKTMVKRLHSNGIEVILDVVYNHTAEGNHLGPDAVFSRHRQRGLLPPGGRRSALLHGLHRLRQQPQHDASARAAADHGQPALLGAGNARRRVPLRSGTDAGARGTRRRPLRRLPGYHPPGSGAVTGETDRRTLGPRRGRLPGRQLPGRLDRVERALPRYGACLLEGRRQPDRRTRLPYHRVPAICTPTAAGAPTPASISSPVTTASRCRIW